MGSIAKFKSMLCCWSKFATVSVSVRLMDLHCRARTFCVRHLKPCQHVHCLRYCNDRRVCSSSLRGPTTLQTNPVHCAELTSHCTYSIRKTAAYGPFTGKKVYWRSTSTVNATSVRTRADDEQTADRWGGEWGAANNYRTTITTRTTKTTSREKTDDGPCSLSIRSGVSGVADQIAR